MLTICRAGDREHHRLRRVHVWLSPELPGAGFALRESVVPPGGQLPLHDNQHAELLRYVRAGFLTYVAPSGGAATARTNELLRVGLGGRPRDPAPRASRRDGARVFEVLFPAARAVEAAPDRRLFSAAQRQGGLCPVASSDGRGASLLLRADALVLSALLRPGRHVVHELPLERRVWVHVVDGAVAFRDEILRAGDGFGITDEPAIGLTALEDSEVLVVEVAG